MSIIIYTCPQCGEELEEIMVATFPPIHVTKCRSCGWKSEKQDDVIRIPYPTSPNPSPVVITTHADYTPKPCKNCTNHPSNGGSGICHCVLGSQFSTTY